MKEENALQIHTGDKFNELDPIVQNAHLGDTELNGYIEVKRGGVLSNLICTILGLPKAGGKIKNIVYGYHYPDHMIWERTFDGKPFNSCFNLAGDYLVESMGPLKLYLKATSEKGTLSYNLSHAEYHGITLPKVIAPTLSAAEKEVNSRYFFLVAVSMPIVGLLIRYSGTLDLVCHKK
jgi:Domain of unknown function (DUF4166)